MSYIKGKNIESPIELSMSRPGTYLWMADLAAGWWWRVEDDDLWISSTRLLFDFLAMGPNSTSSKRKICSYRG